MNPITHFISQIIHPTVAEPAVVGEQSQQCNYADNYYGDQQCTGASRHQN